MIQHPGSAAGRFLRKAGLALAWAAVFGSLFAILSYFRPPRPGLEGAELSPPLHLQLRRWLERLELATYDWRAQALGRSSEPPQDVVVVALDEATLNEAARDRDPKVATQPWPREVVGALVGELVSQGAKLVLLDAPFAALSPRSCGEGQDDDRSFRRLLDAVDQRSVLAFAARPVERRHLGAERSLHELALVDQVEDKDSAAELIRDVLAQRRPAYSIPDGARTQVWAAVASADDARALLLGLRAEGQEPVLRPKTNLEAGYEVTAADLLVWLSEVQVEGLDPARVQEVKALEHPAAPLLGQGSLYGGVLAPPDQDGKVRALPQLVRVMGRDGRGHLLPSMPLAAAMKLANTRKLQYRGGRLHVGDRFSIPMDETGHSLIRWDRPDAYDAAGSLDLAIPAWNVLTRLRERQEGHPRPRTMSTADGRVVVFTDATVHGGQAWDTPVGAGLPSGAVVGQAVANLLRSEGIVRVPARWDALAALGLAFVGAFLALSFSGALRSAPGAAFYVLILVVAASAWALFTRYLFVHEQQWVALAGPLLALGSTFGLVTLHSIRTEQEVREFIFSVLGRSVSPEVARQVARNFNLIRPERREVTVYFSDLEGFTRASEKAEPQKLVELLQEYFGEMTTLVRATSGHLDKFMGDAVMALWNAPNPNPRHAAQACESALRMRDAVQRRQAEWEKKYGYRLWARAGINTGQAVVGHMGSDLQAAYTAIGEAVNQAARLERLNREWGTTILVGEETWERAHDAFIFREVDRRPVEGRAVPVRIFELLARRAEAGSAEALRAAFEEALAHFRERRFDEASEGFSQIAAAHDDPVAAAYLARCRELKAAPPPLDWDGGFGGRG